MQLRRLTGLAALVSLSALPARSFAPKSPGSLSLLEHRVSLIVPAQDPAAQGLLRTSHPGIVALTEEARGPWSVDFDVTNGRLRRALGTGIPLLPASEPGAPRGASLKNEDVVSIARAFLERHNDLIEVDLTEWTADEAGTQTLDNGRIRTVLFRRHVDGVTVEYAALQLVFKLGNLIYINAVGLDPVRESAVPTLDDEATWAAVKGAAASVQASVDGADLVDHPSLHFLPQQSAAGAPVSYRLVRRHTFKLASGVETWRAAVDAHTGELVEIEDLNRYACALDESLVQGQVRGGVRPSQATDPEVVRDFVYPRVNDAGTTKNGDSNGYFTYGGPTATATMNGSFFRVNCTGCTDQPTRDRDRWHPRFRHRRQRTRPPTAGARRPTAPRSTTSTSRAPSPPSGSPRPWMHDQRAHQHQHRPDLQRVLGRQLAQLLPLRRRLRQHRRDPRRHAARVGPWPRRERRHTARRRRDRRSLRRPHGAVRRPRLLHRPVVLRPTTRVRTARPSRPARHARRAPASATSTRSARPRV